MELQASMTAAESLSETVFISIVGADDSDLDALEMDRHSAHAMRVDAFQVGVHQVVGIDQCLFRLMPVFSNISAQNFFRGQLV